MRVIYSVLVFIVGTHNELIATSATVGDCEA
jgi:hypothetical protein